MEDLCRKRAVILFADLANSSVLADILSPEKYAEMRKEFCDTMESVAKAVVSQYSYQETLQYKINPVGDEVSIFLYSGEPITETRDVNSVSCAIVDDSAVIRDVRSALQIAISGKIAWLTSFFNQERIKQGKPPEDTGIGVHTGLVVAPKSSQGDVQGFAINLAKRIEGESRKGKYFKICVCYKVFRASQQLTDPMTYFEGPDLAMLKGVHQPIPIYELTGFFWDGFSSWGLREQIAEDKLIQAYLNSARDLWIGSVLLNQFFDKSEFWRVENLGRDLDRLDDSLFIAPYFVGLAFLRDAEGELDQEQKKIKAKKAAFWLERAKRILPGEAAAYKQCEEAYILAGETDKAIANMAEYKAFEPSAPPEEESKTT